MRSQHAFKRKNVSSPSLLTLGITVDTYGAMMAREPEGGKDPTPPMASGTWLNQSSSWLDNVALLSEYQDPAWLASL